jgi:hypothetical protein
MSSDTCHHMKYAAAPNGTATKKRNNECDRAKTLIVTNVPANTAAIPKTSVSLSTLLVRTETA